MAKQDTGEIVGSDGHYGLHPVLLVDAIEVPTTEAVFGYVEDGFDRVDQLDGTADPNGDTYQDQASHIYDTEFIGMDSMTKAYWGALAIRETSGIITPGLVARSLGFSALSELANVNLTELPVDLLKKLSLLWWTARQIAYPYDEPTAQAWLTGGAPLDTPPVELVRTSGTAIEAAIRVVPRLRDFIF